MTSKTGLAIAILALGALAQDGSYINYISGTIMNGPLPVAGYQWPGHFGGHFGGPFARPFGGPANNVDVGCPILDNPICGIDGKTYQNICYADKAGVKKAYDGWCKNTPASNSSSSNSSNPVVDDITAQTPENGYLEYGASSSGNCACSALLKPACSSNGITFQNPCVAACYGQNPIYNGPCDNWNWKPLPRTFCTCADTLSTVCANDGTTYQNTCVSKCMNATLNPVTNSCPRIGNCQFIFKPVCAQSGRTYMNDCELNFDKVKKVFDGTCDNAMTSKCAHCIGPISKVCGKDGKNYDNVCFLKCNNIELAFNGECPLNTVSGACPSVFLPVCSSDGVTFDNECKARAAGKKVVFNGPCDAKQSNDGPAANGNNFQACANNCVSQGGNPVCGSDGKSYGNNCVVSCTSILSPVQVVVVDGKQPCKPIYNPICACNTEFKPVCGVDGKTYLNICSLKCVGINKAWDGACDIIGNTGYTLSQYHDFPEGPGFDPADNSQNQDANNNRRKKNSKIEEKFIVKRITRRVKKPANKPAKKDNSKPEAQDCFLIADAEDTNADVPQVEEPVETQKCERSGKSKKSIKTSSTSGFMFKLPSITTVSSQHELLKPFVRNSEVQLPTLEKMIAVLYPGQVAKDPKTCKGWVNEDSDIKQKLAENPIKIFISVENVDLSKKDKFDYSTLKNDWDCLTSSQKNNLSRNAQISYAFMFSLIFNELASPDSSFGTCKVKDVLLFLLLDCLKINSKVSSDTISLPTETSMKIEKTTTDVTIKHTSTGSSKQVTAQDLDSIIAKYGLKEFYDQPVQKTETKIYEEPAHAPATISRINIMVGSTNDEVYTP